MMKNLHRTHNRIVATYLAIPCLSMILTFILAKVFGVLLPFRLVGTVMTATPAVCAAMRLKLWSNRNSQFSSEELDSTAVKIFFYAIPAELLFTVVGLMFIWTE